MTTVLSPPVFLVVTKPPTILASISSTGPFIILHTSVTFFHRAQRHRKSLKIPVHEHEQRGLGPSKMIKSLSRDYLKLASCNLITCIANINAHYPLLQKTEILL